MFKSKSEFIINPKIINTGALIERFIAAPSKKVAEGAKKGAETAKKADVVAVPRNDSKCAIIGSDNRTSAVLKEPIGQSGAYYLTKTGPRAGSSWDAETICIDDDGKPTEWNFFSRMSVDWSEIYQLGIKFDKEGRITNMRLFYIDGIPKRIVDARILVKESGEMEITDILTKKSAHKNEILSKAKRILERGARFGA